jgi:hypothetical protein
MRIVAVLSFLLLFGSAAVAQQQQRLAIEQQQVADQLRRLNKLLVDLEGSEREQGNIELADTLAAVHGYMNDATGVGDLVLAIQKVSQQLQQQRNASALNSQALLLEQLQLLLDMLLNSKAEVQAEKQAKILEERQQQLQEMIEQQQALQQALQEFQESQELQKADQSEEGSELSAEDAQELQELQELQQQLADQTEAFNEQQQQQGIKSEESEDAQQQQQQASEQMEQGDLQEAEESQEQAIEELQKAEQEVQEQQQENESQKKQEALLNVEQAITDILYEQQHHHAQLKEISLDQSSRADELPRSSRIKLKKISTAHQQISLRADDLLLEISQAGADSFPFYILALMEDHQLLGDSLALTPANLAESSLELSASLIDSWQELLDVIITERERERKKEEGEPEDGQPGDEDERPLVQFTVELQLLKRMQIDLSRRIQRLSDDTSSDAFKKLVQRQADLQLQYESMIRRLQGANDKNQTEEI